MGAERPANKSELKASGELSIPFYGAERHAKHLKDQEKEIKSKVDDFKAEINQSNANFSAIDPRSVMYSHKNGFESSISDRMSSQRKYRGLRNNQTPYIRWLSATTIWHLKLASRYSTYQPKRQAFLLTAKEILLSGEHILLQKANQGKNQKTTAETSIDYVSITPLMMEIMNNQSDEDTLRRLLTDYVNRPQRSTPELQRTEV